MNKTELLAYARKQFQSEPEYLWAKHPTDCILRHMTNRKWYAVIMSVSGKKLGLLEDRVMDILNVKCDPILLGSLLCNNNSRGFLPAYHMNKSNWVTILLDGSVPDNEIINLLTMSYRLTKGKAPRKL